MYPPQITAIFRDCRFCFMCRHVCSVGNITNRESNTPRGFALLADKSEMNPAVMDDPAFGQTIHECTLCGACRSHCVSDHDVPTFVKAARGAVHRAGKSPAPVQALVRAIEETGNHFGERRARWDGIADAAAAKPGAEVLVYAGAHAAYRVPEALTACLAILKRCGIAYSVLRDEPDSGKLLLNLGADDAARKAAQRLSDAIGKSGSKTVLTLCPSDWDALTVDYPAFGVALPAGVSVLPTALFYAGLLKDGRLTIAKRLAQPLAFIDSDYLRKYHKVVDEVRVLAKAIGPGSVIEIGSNIEESYAAGEGAIAYELVNPVIAKPLFARAAERIAATKTVAVCSSPITKANVRELLPAGAIITIDEAVASAQG